MISEIARMLLHNLPECMRMRRRSALPLEKEPFRVTAERIVCVPPCVTVRWFAFAHYRKTFCPLKKDEGLVTVLVFLRSQYIDI